MGDHDIEPVPAEHLDEQFQVLSFAGEVEFASDHRRQLFDHFPRPPGGEGVDVLGELRQSGQDFDVLPHPRFDLGALDLDHDRSAVPQQRAVDLSDRRRRERDRIDRAELFAERVAELPREGRLDRLDRLRVDVRPQPFEFLGEFGPHQVGTSRQDLAELDERRAELGERHPNPLFPRVFRQRDSGPVLERLPEREPLESAQPVGQPVPAEDVQDLPPTSQVPVQLGDRGDLHGTIVVRGRRGGELPSPRESDRRRLGRRLSRWRRKIRTGRPYETPAADPPAEESPLTVS